MTRRIFLLVWFFVCTSGPIWAQNYTAEELDTLVGSIALYPDPLLTNVLVSATYPDQVQAAYDYVIRDGNSDVAGQGWDASVKAICAYSDVLTDFGGSPDWVAGLGWAVTNQQPDVMDAVQRFRFQAQTAGNLQSSDKLSVLEEGTTIRIESASPEVIYVPSYDPKVVTQVIYEDDDDFGEVFAWGAGVATSALLWNNVCNWGDGCFYRPGVGWAPGAGYYRPYGAAGSGIYNRNNAWSPNRNTNINRPVNINNINTGNRNNINVSNRNNVGNRNNVSNRNGAGNRPGGVSGNRPGAGNRPAAVRPAPRPSLSPGSNVGRGNAGSRPSASTRPSNSAGRSRSGMGSYTSSGNTARQSNRGASSRGSRSMSSGGRPSGGRSSSARSSGARSGGRSGGGRRR
jgi:hypothetical protein